MFTHRWFAHRSAAVILKKRLLTAVTTATLIIASAGAAAAVNSASATVEFSVEGIAAIEVTGKLSGPLTLTVPDRGDTSPISDSSTYVRYTSLVREGETRTITAVISSGTLPSGCALRLEVVGLSTNCSAGAAVPGGVYLSSSPQSLLTGIGNCATGTGSTDGVRIAYELVVENGANLVAGQTTTVVVSFILD